MKPLGKRIKNSKCKPYKFLSALLIFSLPATCIGKCKYLIANKLDHHLQTLAFPCYLRVVSVVFHFDVNTVDGIGLVHCQSKMVVVYEWNRKIEAPKHTADMSHTGQKNVGTIQKTVKCHNIKEFRRKSIKSVSCCLVLILFAPGRCY